MDDNGRLNNECDGKLSKKEKEKLYKLLLQKLDQEIEFVNVTDTNCIPKEEKIIKLFKDSIPIGNDYQEVTALNIPSKLKQKKDYKKVVVSFEDLFPKH